MTLSTVGFLNELFPIKIFDTRLLSSATTTATTRNNWKTKLAGSLDHFYFNYFSKIRFSNWQKNYDYIGNIFTASKPTTPLLLLRKVTVNASTANGAYRAFWFTEGRFSFRVEDRLHERQVEGNMFTRFFFQMDHSRGF